MHTNQDEIPLEDKVKAICRVAYAVSADLFIFTRLHSSDHRQATLRGKYEVALEVLGSIENSAFRVLKLQQYITSYIGFVKAKRALRR